MERVRRVVKTPQKIPADDTVSATKPAVVDNDSASNEQSATAAASPPTRKNNVSGVLWGLALLAIVIGGGYAVLPLWKTYVPGLAGPVQTAPVQDNLATADIDRERDALNARLGVLIDRVQTLEQQLGDVRKMVDATALPDDIANTHKSLQQLSGRLTKIEESSGAVETVLDRLNRLEQDVSAATATSPPETTAAIGEIAKRLESLETGSDAERRKNAEQSKAQALILAIGQLREILPSGAPYAPALQTVLRIGGKDSQIIEVAQALQADAETGVPSLKTLTREYSGLSGEITRTAQGGDESFLRRTVDRVKALVRISRVDDPTSAEGRADAAEQALREGDLATAVGILQALPDPPAPVRDWIRRAESRLAAERALALLNVHAVSLLTPMTE